MYIFPHRISTLVLNSYHSVGVSLARGPPVDIELPVVDVLVNDDDAHKGHQGSPPISDEHNSDAQKGRKKRQPFVVELESEVLNYRL